MKLSKSKMAAATFGAAMTSLYAAPELNANIVSLTFTPGSLGWASGSAPAASIAIDQIGVSFSQWNDSVGKSIGANSLSSINFVSFGQSLAASTFSGTGGLGVSAGASGTAYVGFRSGGNVGWFSLNFGGFGGNVTYLGGEYGDAGETVVVGGTPAIPEPTGVGLAALAMGVAGLRRRRKAS